MISKHLVLTAEEKFTYLREKGLSVTGAVAFQAASVVWRSRYDQEFACDNFLYKQRNYVCKYIE